MYIQHYFKNTHLRSCATICLVAIAQINFTYDSADATNLVVKVSLRYNFKTVKPTIKQTGKILQGSDHLVQED